MQIYTPHTLWAGYDRRALPLNVTELSKTECEMYTLTHLYFNGEAAADGCTRIFAALYRPKNASGAGVIYAEDIGHGPNDRVIDELLSDGYTVLFVDYTGDKRDAKFTIYPPSLRYADLSYNPGALNELPEDAQESCWYIWTTVLLRAFTFLEGLDGIDAFRIAYLGVKCGAFSVIKASHLTPEAAASVTLYNAGYLKDINLDADKTAAYNAALDNTAYTALTQNPLLIVACTNPSDHSSAYMNELFGAADCREVGRTVAVRSTDVLDEKTRESIRRYLSLKTAERAPLPAAPKLYAKNSEGSLYLSVENAVGETVRLMLATEVDDERFRSWRVLPLTKTGEGEYFAKTDVYDEDTEVIAFVETEEVPGLFLSSETLHIHPKAMGIKPHTLKTTRLVYNADEDGAEPFELRNAANAGHAPAGIVLDANGIAGVTAESKTLATLLIGDGKTRGSGDLSLQILYRAPLGGALTVSVTAKTEGGDYREYTTTKNLETTPAWQKLLLSPGELHAGEGTLTSWAHAVSLVFLWEQEVYINSLIWI